MSEYSKDFLSLQDRDRLLINEIEEEASSELEDSDTNSNSSEEMSIEFE
jgi:hypothetical protein